MAKKLKKKTIAILGVVIAIIIGAFFKIKEQFEPNVVLYGVPSGHYDEGMIMFYNSKFVGYEGERRKGAQIKTLIDTIRAHNNENIQENEKIVTFNGISEVEELVKIKTTIMPSKTYTISFEYDENGLIKNIICEEVK